MISNSFWMTDRFNRDPAEHRVLVVFSLQFSADVISWWSFWNPAVRPHPEKVFLVIPFDLWPPVVQWPSSAADWESLLPLRRSCKWIKGWIEQERGVFICAADVWIVQKREPLTPLTALLSVIGMLNYGAKSRLAALFTLTVWHLIVFKQFFPPINDLYYSGLIALAMFHWFADLSFFFICL